MNKIFTVVAFIGVWVGTFVLMFCMSVPFLGLLNVIIFDMALTEDWRIFFGACALISVFASFAMTAQESI